MSLENLTVVRAEIELHRSLDHMYVVAICNVFVAEGRVIYLVTELIKGKDLFDGILERRWYKEL